MQMNFHAAIPLTDEYRYIMLPRISPINVSLGITNLTGIVLVK